MNTTDQPTMQQKFPAMFRPEPPLPPPDPNRTVEQIWDAFTAAMKPVQATVSAWEQHARPHLRAAGMPTDPADPRSRPLAYRLLSALRADRAGQLDRAAEAARNILTALAPADGFEQRAKWLALVDALANEQFCRQFRFRYDDEEGYDKNELVAGLLIPGQPLVIGGRSKCMKTTLAARMAASLLYGDPFLGRATKPADVVYLTLERSPADVGRMIDKFIGDDRFNNTPADDLRFPAVTGKKALIATADGRADLERYCLAATGDVVAFLDPLYLLTGGGTGTDLAAAGNKLRQLVKPIVAGGGTPVLIHHTKRSEAVGEWPEIDDLNGAGVSEFARSWLLLARETEYAGGGVHNLMAVTGTSRGAHDRLRVRVDETAWTVTARPDAPPPPPASPHRPPTRKGGR